MKIDREKVERAIYAGQGWLAYHTDRTGFSSPIAPRITEKGLGIPQLAFSFWYAPEYEEAKSLMWDLKFRFGGNRYPIAAGLFVRPMGDVKADDDFSYNPESLKGFLRAAAETSTKVVIHTSGTQWTEVCYRPSPLLRMLEQNEENLMRYEDETRVERKLQDPGDQLRWDFLRRIFRADRNGVLYLSHHTPDVIRYTNRNLGQMARVVAEAEKEHPGTILAISTRQELDYPGKWVSGDGRQTGWEQYSKLAFWQAKEKIPELDFEDFRKLTVSQALQADVRIFREAGIAGNLIYTNQSIADVENRASPLSTANISDVNIGVTYWGTGNLASYKETADLAEMVNKKWALMITNPVSLDVESNIREIRAALSFDPAFICFYNWWPYFWGYGIKGMPLEAAIQSLK